jgi:integrase
MSAHGFRTLASTRLHEMGWNTAVIERQLAHRDPNTVRAVYNRAQHLEERRTMMQAWADHLADLEAADTHR